MRSVYASSNIGTATFFFAGSTETALSTAETPNGTGIGRRIWLQRDPQSGSIAAGLTNRNNSHYRVWVDGDSLARLWVGDPTSANDTTGSSVVIGTQTSVLESKELLSDRPTEPSLAMQFIMQGAAATRRYRYKSLDEDGNYVDGGNWEQRPYGGEPFEGIVLGLPSVDTSRYGMDMSREYPQGRSLNTINAIGDLMVGVSWHEQRVRELERKLEEHGRL